MCLWCCWKDLDEQDIMEFYLVIFGFRMWEDIDLNVISAAENSNKFQKTRFWKEKSVENVVTLECSPQFNSSMISFHIWHR